MQVSLDKFHTLHYNINKVLLYLHTSVIYMYNRDILPKIWAQIDSPDILVLIGARQVGKTSIMRLIQEKLTSEKNVPANDIFFYDLENIADRQIFEDQVLAQDRLASDLHSRRYIFIDEFQRLPHVPSMLKYLRDNFPLLKFIVSGSSSLTIKNLVTESLLGRAQTFVIYPLSFSEFLLFKNQTELLSLLRQVESDKKLTPAETSLLSSPLQEMQTFGGYPRITLTPDSEQKKNLLLEQINRYLEKDIQLLIREASLPIFEQLLSLLAGQDGGLLNINTVAKTIKTHHKTTARYLEIIRGTYLLNSLSAYSKDKTVETSKMRKVYFNDIGYVNALNKNFSYQPGTLMAGQAAENFVLGELLKHSHPIDALYYWRTKQNQEVDFVWRRENTVVPIEVKAGYADSVPSGLKSFIKRHHPAQAFVMNQDVFKEMGFEKCRVLFRPLWWPILPL